MQSLLNFSIIPNGEAFELLCEDLLRGMGLRIVEKVARGPDFGKDIIAELVQEDVVGVKETHRYLVECKHHARGKRKASVKENEVGSIAQRLGDHDCDRYLLITSTVPSEKVRRQVGGLKNIAPAYCGIIWSANDLVRMLEDRPRIWHRHASPYLTVSPATHSITEQGSRDAINEIHSMLKGAGSARFDAVALSAHNLDYIHFIDLLAPDHETTIEKPVSSPGGSGANTICGLASLGWATGIAGIVADDAVGHELLRDLDKRGIERANVDMAPARSNKRTGTTWVYVDQFGRRNIYVLPGVNNYWASEFTKRRGCAKLVKFLATSRIVHLSSFTQQAELKLQLQLLQDLPSQVVVSFTPGSLYAKLGLDGLVSILSRVNILFLYEQHLSTLLRPTIGARVERMDADDKLACLFEWKRKRRFQQPLVVAVKRASPPERGVRDPEYLILAAGFDRVDSLEAPRPLLKNATIPIVKDVTGAGDALAAGVLSGLLTGRKLSDCAEMGFVMSQLVSGTVGNRQGLPNRETFLNIFNRWFQF